MTFDLPEIKTARPRLVRRLRWCLGEFFWAVQGPDLVSPSRPERLGLHLVASGQMIEPERLSILAARSGFGPNVDVRRIDAAPNSLRDIAKYLTRHMARDGYRLSEHHPRVDLGYVSQGWTRRAS